MPITVTRREASWADRVYSRAAHISKEGIAASVWHRLGTSLDAVGPTSRGKGAVTPRVSMTIARSLKPATIRSARPATWAEKP